MCRWKSDSSVGSVCVGMCLTVQFSYFESGTCECMDLVSLKDNMTRWGEVYDNLRKNRRSQESCAKETYLNNFRSNQATRTQYCIWIGQWLEPSSSAPGIRLTPTLHQKGVWTEGSFQIQPVHETELDFVACLFFWSLSLLKLVLLQVTFAGSLPHLLLIALPNLISSFPLPFLSRQ